MGTLREILNQFEKFYFVNYENVGDYQALLSTGSINKIP
jgi:hypothetical protein